MRPGRELAGRLALLASLPAGSRAAGLFQAISQMPSCGTECLNSTIASSSCGFNVSCICSDKELYEAAQSCILEKCTVLEGLEVARIDADACERPRRSRQTELLIPLIVEVPAWFCPWLRLYSRWTSSNGHAEDDWMMVVCGVLFTIFLIVGHYTGMLAFGIDTWTVRPEAVTQGLKLFYVEETFYLICLCLTKVSVLCFYLRIFPHQRFRWAAHTTMAFVVAPTLILVLMQVFQCVPIRYVWEGWMDSAQEHRCVDMNTLAYTAASFSIAQDLVILVLPLPLLVNLNTATRSKVGIIIMFSMGVFVLVTSCVRLRYMVTFGQSSNPSWDFANPLIWSGLEVAVSIIVACLPSLRVLFISLMPGLFSSIVSGGGNSSREGNLKETSGLSSGAGARSCGGGGGGTKRSRQRRSLIFFASKDREGEGNESQTELGLHLHLGDKMRGEVQTEICGPQQDYEERDGGGIRIKTTTTTRVDVDD